MRPIFCQSPIVLSRCSTYTGKCRIDSTYGIRLRICIEEMQEMRRLDDNGHHAGVVSEQETAIGSEHCEQHVEEKTHVRCCTSHGTQVDLGRKSLGWGDVEVFMETTRPKVTLLYNADRAYCTTPQKPGAGNRP